MNACQNSSMRTLYNERPTAETLSCDNDHMLAISADPSWPSHMQVIRLPLDIWAIFKRLMTPNEWAGACGINHITYGLRRQLVAAKVRSCQGNDGQRRLSMQHLQLDRWRDCHSLFLDTRQLNEAVEITPAEMEQMALAGKEMPKLHCLHFTGGPLRGTAIENMLINLLAKHAVVLTLQVDLAIVPEPLQPPLALLNLQHLALMDMESGYRMTWPWSSREFTNDGLFSTINELTSLKTLYMQALKGRRHLKQVYPHGCVDLRGCKNLQRVVVQGFILHRAVALPAGCLLQAIGKPNLTSTEYFEVTREMSSYVTGLMLRQDSALGSRDHYHRWMDKGLLEKLPKMQNLKQLRIILGKGYLTERGNAPSELRINLDIDQLPCLEVLELGVEGDLAVYIPLQNKLEVLVIIASGVLHVSDSLLAPHPDYGSWSFCSNELCQLPIAPTKQMYLHLGMAYSQGAASANAESSIAKMRLLEYVVFGDGGWTARMPADLQHSSLQECFCGACLECLARAGAPLLCGQASTSEGFDKYLA